MKNLVHIINFACTKQLVETIQSLVTCRQGSFASKKIEEIIHIYNETREKADDLIQFQWTYAEVVSLANELGIEKK